MEDCGWPTQWAKQPCTNRATWIVVQCHENCKGLCTTAALQEDQLWMWLRCSPTHHGQRSITEQHERFRRRRQWSWRWAVKKLHLWQTRITIFKEVKGKMFLPHTTLSWGFSPVNQHIFTPPSKNHLDQKWDVFLFLSLISYYQTLQSIMKWMNDTIYGQ